MRSLLAVFATLTCAALLVAEPEKKEEAKKPARVVASGTLACLHCTFGQGDSCATALKLDDKTPLVLEGDAAKDLFKQRMSKKPYVVEGTITIKDKRMVFTADKVRAHEEKNKEPALGTAYVVGDAICGKCDLDQCETCTLAVRNDKQPIILDGDLASDHAEGKGTLLVTGKLKIDKRGLLRLEATKVDSKK